MELALDNVAVECGGRLVVRRAQFSIRSSETLLLLGPNGSGKSSLLMAIAGSPRYRIVHGTIKLDDVNLATLSVEERRALGIGIAVQHPPRLKGIKLRKLLEEVAKQRIRSLVEVQRFVNEVSRVLSLNELLDRDFGVGFSGGELKRAELALLIAQQPRIALIDEPDSGVDVDSVLMMAEAIEELLRRTAEIMVIVTHSGLIARHVKHNKAVVMLNGETVAFGPSSDILEKVLSRGFTHFVSR